MKKNLISVLLSISLILCVGFNGPANVVQAFGVEPTHEHPCIVSNDGQLVDIFTTNDVHADISQCDNPNGGLSYSNMAKLKIDNTNSVLVDAGDHSSGGLYSKFDNGHTMVELMKLSGYSFAVPGNHEFDHGVQNFQELKAFAEDPSVGSTFEYLACNFYKVNASTQTREENVLSSYKTITINNVKITFVGVMTPETIYKTSPAYFQDQEGNFIYGISSGEAMYKDFNDTVALAKQNDNPDIVVGVGHLGVDESSGVNTSKNLVAKSSGINAFIDGHSHTVIPREASGEDAGDDGKWNSLSGTVKAVQTGTAFGNVGHLKILGSTSNYEVDNSVISKNTFLPESRDASVAVVEKNWKQEVDSKYDTQIAKTDTTFMFSQGNVKGDDSKRYVRRRETNLTDLVADGFYWKGNTAELGGCDVAINNGGAIKDYIDGTMAISRRNCATILPYGNRLGIASMPGSLLREVLEFSYMNYGCKGDDGLYIEAGGLMATSGISFTVDPNKKSTVKTVNDEGKVWEAPPTDGQYRVKNIQIYNKTTATYEDIDFNRYYKVAGTTYFFSNFGDGFTMFRNKDVSVVASEYLDDVALGDYFDSFTKVESNGTVSLISTATSPLTAYPNFQINYEQPFGANRVGLYNVSFNTDGGSYVPSQNVYLNSSVLKPLASPVKANYDFAGWYSDEQKTTEFDFAQEINIDTTIYAKWNEAPIVDPQNSGLATTFDNVGLWLLIALCVLIITSGSIIAYKKRYVIFK